MNVLKRDRSTEAFSSSKLIRGCKRAGCTSTVAKIVAARVRKRAYNRISTSKIRKLAIATIRMYDSRSAKAFAGHKRH
ncbi:TPA: hypothetical protein H1005_02655 [archaeon]|uniref:ATP-cone domain-containing protein n=1 Tax=Candidatus Naiadarchaeum limnaeum TaxID=2756139 RepID=A0A832V2T9_9ARCH|nr:hypothetical protein [Candidatus Naiadarchaeales archaeon SRR2090153.bin1042]HIJ99966.1 hypothetical protein [Candidatus Naiadarchaeum limnaeum]